MWKEMKSGSNKIVVFTFGMVSLNRQLFSQKSGAFNFLKFVPISFGMVSLKHWLFSQKSGELNFFDDCPHFFWNGEFESSII